jgi:hypothetical protein
MKVAPPPKKKLFYERGVGKMKNGKEKREENTRRRERV